jgi:Ca2+/H+ antiporter
MSTERMNLLLKEVRHNPMLWLLAFVPVMFAAAKLKPEAHTLLFVLSVLAIVPLAALLSHATESVAAKTGFLDISTWRSNDRLWPVSDRRVRRS